MNILITGATGMVGSALADRLKQDNALNILTPTRKELDLLSQDSIRQFFQHYSLYSNSHIDFIFHCAAKVGGILANRKYPADFFYQNVLMNTLLVEASKNAGVRNMIVLNSGCVYANDYPPPHEEWAILLGQPNKNHAPYAYAKRLLNVQSQAYANQYGMKIIVAILSNLYGPRDNFHDEDSHVIPALIRKFYMAQQNHDTEVKVWGDGFPIRDFLFVDDLVDALVTLYHYSLDDNKVVQYDTFNIGSGQGLTIQQVCASIQQVLGYSAKIIWDTGKPNGQMEKYLDISRLKQLGWYPKTSLTQGLAKTIQWFDSHVQSGSIRM